MAAITWRNVGGDLGHRDAGYLMQGAQQSINAGIGSMQEALQGYQKTDQENYKVVKDNNTNAFLDRLQSYRSPEELEAARQSGELDQFRQSFGAQIDGAAIRGAEDTRQQGLQQQFLQQGQYQDDVQDRTQRPLVDQLRQAIVNRDRGTFDSILQGNELRDESQFHSQWDERDQTLLERDRAEDRHGWAGQNAQLAQARFNLTKQQHDLTMGEKNTAESVNQLLKGLAGQREAAISQRGQEYAELAKGFPGVKVVDGVPDFSEVGGNRLATEAAFADAATKAGLKPLQTEAQFKREMQQTLRQIPKLSLEQVSALSDSVLNGVTSAGSLSKEGEAMLGSATSRQEEAYQRQLKEDPFTKRTENPEAAALQIMGDLREGGWDPWGRDAPKERELVGYIGRALHGGIEVPGAGKVPVPQELVKLAMQGESNITADELNTKILKYLENDDIRARVTEGDKVHSIHQNNLDNLKRSVRKSEGLAPVPLTDFEKSLFNRVRVD